jgi:hypothetical protein
MLPGLLLVVGLGHEDVLVPAPDGDVVVATVGRDSHEWLGHEAGEGAQLTADLLADLTERGEVVRG